jgi:hypothetical protein
LPVTTESNEMQIPVSVVAFEFLRHRESQKPHVRPAARGRTWGTLTVLCRQSPDCYTPRGLFRHTNQIKAAAPALHASEKSKAPRSPRCAGTNMGHPPDTFRLIQERYTPRVIAPDK